MTTTRPAVAAHDPRLIGGWRIDGEPPACAVAAKYARQLAFAADGTYRGTPATAGEFTWWDVGSWRVKAAGVLALSVANDEVVDYRFELAGDRLSIVDAGGCRVGFVRQPR